MAQLLGCNVMVHFDREKTPHIATAVNSLHSPPHSHSPLDPIRFPPLPRYLNPLPAPSHHPFVSPQQIHTIRQHSSTGPPPLLLAPRASVPSVQIQGQRIIQQGLIRVANVPNTSLLVNIPQVSPDGAPGLGGTVVINDRWVSVSNWHGLLTSNWRGSLFI